MMGGRQELLVGHPLWCIEKQNNIGPTILVSILSIRTGFSGDK